MITGMPRIAIATGDFEGVLDIFQNRLGLPVIDVSEETVPSLGARIAMCVPVGGSNIELMSPEVPEAPLCQSLQRFLDRRGQGLFALMLEAPDPNAEAEILAGRGLNILPLMKGAGGRDVHPNSTHGVLIRIYPVNSFDRKVALGTPPAPLSGVQRVIIAVKDIHAAAQVYGECLGLPTDAVALDTVRGVKQMLVYPPTGGAIELVSVFDRTRPFAAAVAVHLEANPEGLYAMVLHAQDPRAMLEVLRAKGLDARLADDTVDVVEIGRESMSGALLRIERS